MSTGIFRKLEIIIFGGMPKSNTSPEHFFFSNAPIPSAILNAETLKLEMANRHMLDLWGRSEAIIGCPLLDFMPELASQRYPGYLSNVIATGEPLQEHGAEVILDRWGHRQHVFMDYSFTPIPGARQKTNAILVLATDVCEREINRLIVKQSGRDLRALIMSAPIPMCIYKGPALNLEAINDLMLEMLQNDRTMHLRIVRHVFNNGVPYTHTEKHISYSFTPLSHGIKGAEGVCVIARVI